MTEQKNKITDRIENSEKGKKQSEKSESFPWNHMLLYYIYCILIYIYIYIKIHTAVYIHNIY